MILLIKKEKKLPMTRDGHARDPRVIPRGIPRVTRGIFNMIPK
jgi:hypothetical protein